MSEMTRLAYSPRSFAERVDVSHPTVYKWIRAGMPVLRVGGVVRIVPDEAFAWMRAQSAAEGAAKP